MPRGRGKPGYVGYGVKPPYIDLGVAVEIIRRIEEEAGGSVSEDQLSSIVRNSVKSSSFQLKLMALKGFGVVAQESSSRRVELSPTGRGIVAAASPEERVSSLKAAFLRIETYRKLHALWAGKILPAEEFFLNTLKSQGIPSELTKQWKDSFMASGRAAGFFQERPDGKTQVRQDPAVEPVEIPVPNQGGETIQESQTPIRTLAPVSAKGVQRFQIPLLEGKVGAIELPQGWTPADVRKMLRVMNAMFVADNENDES